MNMIFSECICVGVRNGFGHSCSHKFGLLLNWVAEIESIKVRRLHIHINCDKRKMKVSIWSIHASLSWEVESKPTLLTVNHLSLYLSIVQLGKGSDLSHVHIPYQIFRGRHCWSQQRRQRIILLCQIKNRLNLVSLVHNVEVKKAVNLISLDWGVLAIVLESELEGDIFCSEIAHHASVISISLSHVLVWHVDKYLATLVHLH